MVLQSQFDAWEGLGERERDAIYAVEDMLSGIPEGAWLGTLQVHDDGPFNAVIIIPRTMARNGDRYISGSGATRRAAVLDAISNLKEDQ